MRKKILPPREKDEINPRSDPQFIKDDYEIQGYYVAITFTCPILYMVGRQLFRFKRKRQDFIYGFLNGCKGRI